MKHWQHLGSPPMHQWILLDCDAVVRLIMATAHRTPPQEEDEKIVVDVDLSILGESPTQYDPYVRAIRQEYSWVPEGDFRLGRRKFLRGMLKREFIYATPRMRTRFEANARENMQRELRTIAEAERQNA